MSRAFLLLSLLALAACGESTDKGTTLTLNADDGAVRGALDAKSGAVKLDLPGFKGEFKLPKITLNADDFDLNGVHLYPGSTIDSVNVDGRQDDGRVRIAFSSPAGSAKVRDWFQGRLTAAGFTLRSEGDTLVGTTDDGKPFRMELAPAAGDRANGTIVLGS